MPDQPAPNPAPTAAPPAPAAPTPAPEAPKKGYGKRPLWQWVVIYLVAAAIVYGGVYLLFFSGHSAGTSGSFNY